MTAPLTGYNVDLPNDILLDSGVLYVGTKVWGAFSRTPPICRISCS